MESRLNAFGAVKNQGSALNKKTNRCVKLKEKEIKQRRKTLRKMQADRITNKAEIKRKRNKFKKVWRRNKKKLKKLLERLNKELKNNKKNKNKNKNKINISKNHKTKNLKIIIIIIILKMIRISMQNNLRNGIYENYNKKLE